MPPLDAAADLALSEATPGDFAEMLDIWVDAWTVAWPQIDFDARRAWLEGHLDALKAEGTCIFVAVKAGGQVAGFATLDPASGYLDQLVTAPWSQRLGVGRALLRHAKMLSSGSVTLSVNQFNAPAVRLYESEGFQRISEGIAAASGLPTWCMRWTNPEAPTSAQTAPP